MSKYDLGTNVVYTLPYQIILPELESLAFIGLDASNQVNVEYQDNNMRPLKTVYMADNNVILPGYTMEGGLMYHVMEGALDETDTQYALIPPTTTRILLRVVVGTVAFNFSGRTRKENAELASNDWGTYNALNPNLSAPNQYTPLKINASYNYVLEIGTGSYRG